MEEPWLPGPEWPRKVVDIDCDDDLTLPDSIIYAQDSDEGVLDAEEYARKRAAKRRRIEMNAHAYLRGEGIFIMTAGLKGPFGADWQNPWAKTSTKRKRDVLEEETATKRAQKILRKVNDIEPLRESKHPQPARHRSLLDTSQPPARDQMKPEQKVETWLRRTSTLPEQQSFETPASPTSRRAPVATHNRLSSRREWTPTKQIITVSSQNAKAPFYDPDERIVDSFDTVVPAVHTHSRLQDVLGDDDQAKHEKSTSDASARAEAAIRKIKRIPMSAPSPPAPRSVSDTRKSSKSLAPSTGKAHPRATDKRVKLKELESAVDAQLGDSRGKSSRAKQTDVHRLYSAGQPATILPSTAVSDVPSTALLPSAQPRPELQTSTSNFSSEALLVTQPVSGTVQDNWTSVAAIEAASCPPSDIHMSSEGLHEHPPASLSSKMNERCVVLESLLTSLHAMPHMAPLPSKAVDSPGKLEAEDIDLSTSMRTAPAPVNKAKTNKKRKSATFATENTTITSNGSIRNALKVKKVGEPAQKLKSPPPESRKPQDPRKTSTELCVNHTRSPELIVKKPRRSVLKPTHATSSYTTALEAAATLSSKSPITKKGSRDTMMSGQNGLSQNADDNFDLDGAMDELGSFLSTWDAEKSALKI